MMLWNFPTSKEAEARGPTTRQRRVFNLRWLQVLGEVFSLGYQASEAT